MTKMYENSLEDNEKTDLALINALTGANTLVKSLIKRQQTCKKSTSGFLKYSNLVQQKQQNNMTYLEARSVSNDSSIDLNFNDNVSTSSGNSPQLGLKLVFKRQSGDKYEVKNSTNLSMSLNENMFLSTQRTTFRPKREASRKVKFTFNEYETDLDSISPTRKRLKLSSNQVQDTKNFEMFIRQKSEPSSNTTIKNQIIQKTNSYEPLVKNVSKENNEIIAKILEASVRFSSDELVKPNADEIEKILRNQPRTIVNRSKPFPIALVEDKTNVVYTKAILLLHLFKSYLAPCIHCPWCNKILNVSEFSKHLHIDQIDDDEEEDDEDSDDSSRLSDDYEFSTQDEKQTYLMQRKKQKKYIKLIKKSYKILPYCFNTNEELSEEDIKRWKIFGDKFSSYKQRYLKNIKEQQLLRESIAKNATKTRQNSSSSRFSTDEQLVDSKYFKDWDCVDEANKIFFINNNRIITDAVVYLDNLENMIESIQESTTTTSKVEQKLESNPTSNVSDKNTIKQNHKDIRRSNSDDVFLSEDEDKSNESNELPGNKSRKSSSNKSIQINSTDELECSEETLQVSSHFLKYVKKPSMKECFFNLYDNLPKETLIFIKNNQFTIVPNSFLAYCNKKRQLKLAKLKLAKTDLFKVLWLCSTLDLEY